MKQLLQALPAVAVDLAGLAGIGATAYGAWLIYEPAGFIVGGLLTIAAAVLASLGQRKAAS